MRSSVGGGRGTGGNATTRECILPPELLAAGDCDGESTRPTWRTSSVLFAVDASASMNEQPPEWGTSKLNAVSAAIGSAFDGHKGLMQLGLELFPSPPTGSASIPADCQTFAAACCESRPLTEEMNVEVGAGLSALQRIVDELASTVPAGLTPAAQALARARNYYESAAGDAADYRYVLLET